MPKNISVYVALVISSLIFLSPIVFAKGEKKERILSAQKIVLAGYQANELSKDLPASDILFDSKNRLFIAGKTALWQWTLGSGNLKKIPLVKKGGAPLQTIGTDGFNIFAASSNTLFQYQQQGGKIFQYPYPLDNRTNVSSLGFAGIDDKWWWLHSKAVIKIDRYGKRLVPKYRKLNLNAKSKVAFAPKTKTLWFIKDKTIRRSQLNGGKQNELMLQTKYKPVDLQLVESQLFINTRHTVLRMSLDGKLNQSIPVEGARRLQFMSLSPSVHTYLFSDNLVEVYVPSTKTEMRYTLPLDKKSKISAMKGTNSLLAIIVDGRPVAYSLAKRPVSPR